MKFIEFSQHRWIIAGLACALMALATGNASACTWGGASAVDPPIATALRSYPDPHGAPSRVAVDFQGNIYAINTRAGKVLVWDPEGSLISESPDLGGPTALAVSPLGDIYVGEQYSGSVLIFDQDWNLQGQLGAGAGEFLIPNDIAVDPVSGDIYVSDGFAYEIRVYYPSGTFRFSFGGFGSGDQQFKFPSAVHVTAAGEVLVGDQGNDNVKVFDLQGNFKRCFGSNGGYLFRRKFGGVTGLTSDAVGRFYVADAFEGNVQVFDSLGVKLATIGSFGSGPLELRTPIGLVIDPFNRLFVGSVNTGRLVFFGLDSFSDPQPPPVTIADPPSNLVARAISSDWIALTWDDNSDNEKGFFVYRLEGSTWKLIGLNSADDSTFSDTGLEASTTYYYLVEAYNSAGKSAVSNQAFATTLHPPLQYLPATIEIDPWQLKRDTKKTFFKVTIELPDSDVELIDTSSVTANGVVASQQAIKYGDEDKDGIPDVAVKFDAPSLLAELPDGNSAVIVQGALFGGAFFKGTAQVTIFPAKGTN